MRYMITADDYGVSPLIDDAVKDALRKKLISSVAVFPNLLDDKGKFPTHKIQELIDIDPTVKIGLHFTITSGRSVSNEVSSLCRKKSRHFRGVAAQPAGASPKEIVRELEAQIAVFIQNDIPIHHFSDHHGVLTHTARGLQCVRIVVRNYNKRTGKKISLRNPFYVSALIKDQKNCLNSSQLVVKNLPAGLAGNLLRKKKAADVIFDRKKLKAELKNIHDDGIPTTNYFVELYYNNPEEKILACIFNDEHYIPNDFPMALDPKTPTAEVVVHLANPKSAYSKKVYEAHLKQIKQYGGISLNYLKKKRPAEFIGLKNHLRKYLSPHRMM